MFQRAVTVLLSLALFLTIATSATAQDPAPNPRVLVQTSEGDFEIELFRDEPSVIATVVNFLGYVRDGYYDKTVFHRVIRDVIIQGGGFTVDADSMLTPKAEGLRGQIVHQGSVALKNTRGTVAMARGAEPNSARQQFFVNLEDNRNFDFQNPTAAGVGYAVFGRVTQGMDVVNSIGRTRTGSQGPLQEVPREPIIITSITRVEGN